MGNVEENIYNNILSPNPQSPNPHLFSLLICDFSRYCVLIVENSFY